jgi:hypothetical protein
MIGTMRHMWRMGGFKPFFAAYRVTAVREGAPPHRPPTPQSSLHCIGTKCSLLHPAHRLLCEADLLESGIWLHLRKLAHAPPVPASSSFYKRFIVTSIAILDFFCSRQAHSRDAAACSSIGIVTVQSKLLPMHFSREFLCDCSAATFAAIACAQPPSGILHDTVSPAQYLSAASPINYVRNMQLATPAGLFASFLRS